MLLFFYPLSVICFHCFQRFFFLFEPVTFSLSLNQKRSFENEKQRNTRKCAYKCFVVQILAVCCIAWGLQTKQTKKLEHNLDVLVWEEKKMPITKFVWLLTILPFVHTNTQHVIFQEDSKNNRKTIIHCSQSELSFCLWHDVRAITHIRNKQC